VAGFFVFLVRGQTPRVAGSLIFVIVCYQFIKYYVPTDRRWRERLDRYGRWFNSDPRVQSVRGAITVLAVFLVLVLIWLGYIYALVPDQIGWAYLLIAWVLFYGIPMWERLLESYGQPRKRP
jgi:amino acid transporter